MEKEPVPATTKIHLVGPDGWQFSVEKQLKSTSVNLDTPQKPLQEFTLNNPQTIEHPYVQETSTEQTAQQDKTNETNELLDSPAVIGGGALALAAAGIAIYRGLNNPTRFEGTGTRRQRAARRRASDAKIHSQSAQQSLDRLDINPEPLDRVASFKKTHMRRRLKKPIRAGGDGGFTPVAASEARTRTQERAAMRANLREDAINDRVSRADKYRELYGDRILDRDETEEFIEINRVSKKQAKAMRRAGRKARRLLGTEGRIQSRLNRQSQARDLHGLKNRAIRRILRD